MKEQAIVCLACGAAELIRQDSERLPDLKWPAWEPGPQEFTCPACGGGPIWAAEPRESDGEGDPSSTPAARPPEEPAKLRNAE